MANPLNPGGEGTGTREMSCGLRKGVSLRDGSAVVGHAAQHGRRAAPEGRIAQKRGNRGLAGCFYRNAAASKPVQAVQNRQCMLLRDIEGLAAIMATYG